MMMMYVKTVNHSAFFYWPIQERGKNEPLHENAIEDALPHNLHTTKEFLFFSWKKKQLEKRKVAYSFLPVWRVISGLFFKK